MALFTVKNKATGLEADVYDAQPVTLAGVKQEEFLIYNIRWARFEWFPSALFSVPDGGGTIDPGLPIEDIDFPSEAGNQLTGYAGDTVNIAVTIQPSNAEPTGISWESSDESIFTVAGTGLSAVITGVSAGFGTLTARAPSGVATSIEIRILPAKVAVTGIDVLPTTLSIEVGQIGSVTGLVSPSGATDRSFVWSIDDGTIIMQTDNIANIGYFQGLKEGTTTITATTNDGGFTASCAVTVTPAPIRVSGISLDANDLLFNGLGDSKTIIATVTPANADDPSIDINWLTPDDKVSVDYDPSIPGNVHTITLTSTAYGNNTILISTNDGGYVANCQIHVEPVTATGIVITSSPEDSKMKVGETYQLTWNVTPADAPQEVIWEIDATDAGKAEITEDGLITATGFGSLSILGYSATNPSVTTSLGLNIFEPVTGVVLEPNDPIVFNDPEDVQTVKAIVTPQGMVEDSNVNFGTSTGTTSIFVIDGTSARFSPGEEPGTESIKVESREDPTKFSNLSITNNVIPVAVVDIAEPNFIMAPGAEDYIKLTISPPGATFGVETPRCEITFIGATTISISYDENLYFIDGDWHIKIHIPNSATVGQTQEFYFTIFGAKEYTTNNATVEINVIQATAINITIDPDVDSPDTDSIPAGSIVTLTAEVFPSNASDKRIEWITYSNSELVSPDLYANPCLFKLVTPGASAFFACQIYQNPAVADNLTRLIGSAPPEAIHPDKDKFNIIFGFNFNTYVTIEPEEAAQPDNFYVDILNEDETSFENANLYFNCYFNYAFTGVLQLNIDISSELEEVIEEGKIIYFVIRSHLDPTLRSMITARYSVFIFNYFGTGNFQPPIAVGKEYKFFLRVQPHYNLNAGDFPTNLIPSADQINVNWTDLSQNPLNVQFSIGQTIIPTEGDPETAAYGLTNFLFEVTYTLLELPAGGNAASNYIFSASIDNDNFSESGTKSLSLMGLAQAENIVPTHFQLASSQQPVWEYQEVVVIQLRSGLSDEFLPPDPTDYTYDVTFEEIGYAYLTPGLAEANDNGYFSLYCWIIKLPEEDAPVTFSITWTLKSDNSVTYTAPMELYRPTVWTDAEITGPTIPESGILYFDFNESKNFEMSIIPANENPRPTQYQYLFITNYNSFSRILTPDSEGKFNYLTIESKEEPGISALYVQFPANYFDPNYKNQIKKLAYLIAKEGGESGPDIEMDTFNFYVSTYNVEDDRWEAANGRELDSPDIDTLAISLDDVGVSETDNRYVALYINLSPNNCTNPWLDIDYDHSIISVNERERQWYQSGSWGMYIERVGIGSTDLVLTPKGVPALAKKVIITVVE